MPDIAIADGVISQLDRNRYTTYISLLSIALLVLLVCWVVWRIRAKEAGIDSLATGMIRSFVVAGVSSILVAKLAIYMLKKDCDPKTIVDGAVETVALAFAVCAPFFVLALDANLFGDISDYYDLQGDHTDSTLHNELARIVIMLGVAVGSSYAWLFNAMQDKRWSAATLCLVAPFLVINIWYLLRRYYHDEVESYHDILLTVGLIIPLVTGVLMLRLGPAAAAPH